MLIRADVSAGSSDCLGRDERPGGPSRRLHYLGTDDIRGWGRGNTFQRHLANGIDRVWQLKGEEVGGEGIRSRGWGGEGKYKSNVGPRPW